MTTPTISEAARRAAEQEIDEFLYRSRITQPRRPFEAGHYVQQALDSAHPAPMEGQPSDELTWEYWRDRARESELRLSEAKRDVEVERETVRILYSKITEYQNAIFYHGPKVTESLRSQLNTANEHLHRVTDELAELIKGEQDDKDVGITGWNALHESVAAARTHLNSQSK